MGDTAGCLQRLVQLHGCLKAVHERCPQRWCIGCAVHLRQSQGCGLKARKLPGTVRFANGIAALWYFLERPAWQGLQRWVQIEHFSAFAPCAIDHNQAQASRLLQPCSRQLRRCHNGQLRILRCRRVEQDGANDRVWRLPLPRRMQPLLQAGWITLLGDFQTAAARQAQV